MQYTCQPLLQYMQHNIVFYILLCHGAKCNASVHVHHVLCPHCIPHQIIAARFLVCTHETVMSLLLHARTQTRMYV